MPGTLLNLCFFLLMFCVEYVFCICDVRVHTINFGCHLEWDCPDAHPETTYTVWAKQNYKKPWTNVLNCTQISGHSCNLSHVFLNPEISNLISLRSEELQWNNTVQTCAPLKDISAKFSPPSVTTSIDAESLWVTVHFPCAPSIFCMVEEDYDDEDDDDYDDEEKVKKESEELEGKCFCPLNEFKSLSATVTLYNTQELSDRQTHTAELILGEEEPVKVKFGFLQPGQRYCAVASFTAAGVNDSSPFSHPFCVSIPANTERLIVVIVFAVLIAVVLMVFLLWKLFPSSEAPLPKALALLQELDLDLDSSKVAPRVEIPDVDYISVETFCDFTLMDDHSFYHNCPGLSNGYYYSSAVLDIPYCTEDTEDSADWDVPHDSLLLFPSHVSLEAERQPVYQNQCEETLNIPLSSVRVRRVQDEASADQPEPE